jgi:hypothetical protein
MFIVELAFHPTHEVINVLGRGTLDGLLDLLVVAPKVLVLSGSGHHRTTLRSAELSDRAVQERNLVEEINGCGQEEDSKGAKRQHTEQMTLSASGLPVAYEHGARASQGRGQSLTDC